MNPIYILKVVNPKTVMKVKQQEDHKRIKE